MYSSSFEQHLAEGTGLWKLRYPWAHRVLPKGNTRKGFEISEIQVPKNLDDISHFLRLTGYCWLISSFFQELHPFWPSFSLICKNTMFRLFGHTNAFESLTDDLRRVSF